MILAADGADVVEEPGLQHDAVADYFAELLHGSGASIREAADRAGTIALLISYHSHWDSKISDRRQREMARTLAAALMEFAER